MKKSTINHLEELYKDEIDSHYLKKAINNINISTLKIKDLEDKRKLSDKYTKYNQDNILKVKNSLLFNNNIKKNSININLFKSKEKIDNLFDNSNSEESQKKKEIIYDSKIKKRNKIITLKVSKTFKNCGDNINKAQLLLFNKGNNKHSVKPLKKSTTKNCLTSKRGKFYQSSKKHKRLRDKEKEKEKENDYPFKNENCNLIKNKKTFYKPSNSNNKLLWLTKNNIISAFKTENYGDNKENINKYYDKDKDNLNYDLNSVKKRAKSNNIKNFKNNLNNISIKNKRIISTRDKSKPDNDTDKNKNKPKIIYDTDNEVENNILCLLDKSFKKKNSVVNIKKNKHYSTQEILNDNILQNFNISLDNKKKSIEIGKITNFDSISIIKKTEFYDINNINNEIEDDFLKRNNEKNNTQFKNISSQKVASFEYKEDENENEVNNYYNNVIINSNNKTLKNKRKNKFIIYNNINYYKNTKREDNDLEDKRNNNNIDNEDKDTKNDNKNSFSNFSKRCYNSFFNCCFLKD